MTVAANTAKEITAFSFTAAANSALSSDVTGTISGTEIDLTVPFGTDVTALVATFTTTGESVTVGGTEQTSGTTSNNFSSPVTYRVTAEDSSTQDYTVTVTISQVGRSELISISSAPDFTMVYAQDRANISFPTGTNDNTPATITTQFWMAETQFTNAQTAAVLQWAYNNGRIVETDGAHNEVNATEVKYGNQKLIGLTETHNRLNYSGGSFSVDSGYDDHPLVRVTWYGAVRLCNWLTEMRDGHEGNLVYGGITTSWDHLDTTEDLTKNGFRLPSRDEWEYTARYLGTTAPTTEPLATERKYGNDNANWTDGYYWTPGNYASGATADYNDTEACQAVAVYSGSDPQPTTTASVKSLGEGSANTLGLYDMSGNVWEWCFTASGSYRIGRGGCWFFPVSLLLVGDWYGHDPDGAGLSLGFRLCRTAD